MPHLLDRILRNIVVIGASGAIGGSLVERLVRLYPDANLTAFSRRFRVFSSPRITSRALNYWSEPEIASAAALSAVEAPLDLVIVASGLLHDDETMPEKSMRDLSSEKFLKLFSANTVTPALIAKHFIPRLTIDTPSIFAVLSARVGSITDNHLGGWYSYRASKAALNMVIKNLAIEATRRNKGAIIVGLHPGTVDSALSKPFQGNVPVGKLFTPDYAAEKLCQVVDQLLPHQSGMCLAWDGQEVKP